MESATENYSEDWLQDSPPRLVAPAPKRKRKLINLDDILSLNHNENIKKLKQENRKISKKPKKPDKPDLYSSSDEDSADETRTTNPDILENLEKQVNDGGVAEEVDLEWGQTAFGPQKEAPFLALSDTDGGLVGRALQKRPERGPKFALELLAGTGFLRSWALCLDHCDATTVRWAFHQMVYSKEEGVERAACKLLCDLVIHSDKVEGRPCKLDWMPSLDDLMSTFWVYGYLGIPASGEIVDALDDANNSGYSARGAPTECALTVGVLAVSYQTRNVHQRFTTSDTENLLVTMAQLLLERCLLSIMRLVQECLITLVEYFSEEEWASSCNHVSILISRLTVERHNGLRLVRGLHGTSSRMDSLQRSVALCELSKCLIHGVSLVSAKDVVASFDSVNVKDKAMDYVDLYHRLMFADFWLWCNPAFQTDKGSLYRWLYFLKSCSLQIFGGDERPFATKVRNRASFLWQKYEHEGDHKQLLPDTETDDLSP